MQYNILKGGMLLIVIALAACVGLLSGSSARGMSGPSSCEDGSQVTIDGTIGERRTTLQDGSKSIGLELEEGATPCEIDQIDVTPGGDMPDNCVAGSRVHATGTVYLHFFDFLLADSVRCNQ